jgi:serine/threonine-protein kinase RsbW/sigma-B regulation protein RsbU (phosphoserine phosphatase)
MRVGNEQTRSFRARRDEMTALLAFVESVVPLEHPGLVGRLRLAAEELFLNTVTHGHGGDTDAPVEVTVRIEAGRVALVYVDTAPAFDPFADVQAPDSRAPLEARPVGRLGVFLITALAERCHYARTGDRNHVTVELRAD